MSVSTYYKQLRDIGDVRFSKRQVEIISLVVLRKSTKEISNILYMIKEHQKINLSVYSINAHISEVSTKITGNRGGRQSILHFVEKHKCATWFQNLGNHLIEKHKFGNFLLKSKDFFNFSTPVYVALGGESAEEDSIFLHQHLKILGIESNLIDVSKNNAMDALHTSSDITLILLDEETNPSLMENFIKSYKDPTKIYFLCPQMLKISFEDLGINRAQIVFRQHEFQRDLVSLLIESGCATKAFKKTWEIFSEDQVSLSVDRKNQIPFIGGVKGFSQGRSEGRKLFPKYWGILGVIVTLVLTTSFFYMHQGAQENVRQELLIPSKGKFLHRDMAVEKINSLFRKKFGDKIPIVLIAGTGGAGKTTLARYYAKKQPSSVLWEMDASDKMTLTNSFITLAYALAHTEQMRSEVKFIENIRDVSKRETQYVYFVRNILHKKKDWFLIFDNVKNIEDMVFMIPSSTEVWGNGKIIITSRDTTLVNDLNVIGEVVLGDVSKNEAKILFSKIRFGQDLNSLTQEQIQYIDTVIENIPLFPLDIQIAAHTLKKTGLSVRDYINILASNDAQNSLDRLAHHKKTRHSIITAAITDIFEKFPQLKEMIFFLSCLGTKDIPVIFLEFFSNKTQALELILHLKKRGLLGVETQDVSSLGLEKITLHEETQRSIFSFFMKQTPPTELKSYFKTYVQLMLKIFNTYKSDFKIMKDILPTLKIFVETIEKNFSDSKHLLSPIYLCIAEIQQNAMRDFHSAKCFLKNIYDTPQIFQNQDISMKKKILKNLILISLEIDEFDDAIDYAEKNLKFAKDENNLLDQSYNLYAQARALSLRGNFLEGEKLFLKSLSVLKNIRHPSDEEIELLSDILGVYGALLQLHNPFSEGLKSAQALILSSLQILESRYPYLKEQKIVDETPGKEKVPNAFRISYLKQLIRLGDISLNMHDFEEAKKIYNSIIKRIEKEPDTLSPLIKARTMRIHSKLLMKENKYNQAIGVLDKCFEVIKKHFSHKNFLIMDLVFDMAYCLYNLKKLDQAVEKFESIVGTNDFMWTINRSKILIAFSHFFLADIMRLQDKPSAYYYHKEEFYRIAKKLGEDFKELGITDDINPFSESKCADKIQHPTKNLVYPVPLPSNAVQIFFPHFSNSHIFSKASMLLW